MRSKFKWIFTLLLAFSMQFSFAQEKTVTGVVTDKIGPLPGANVVVKGTTNGVQTDFDGKYSIKAKSGDILEVSFTGYDKKTVTVGAANSYNVVLSEGVLLDEVVVLGFTSQKKENITTAVSVVGASELQKLSSVTSLDNMLQGKASGVQVVAASGRPGQAARVVIRGANSINGASSNPIYVVDGALMTSIEMNSINPADVESMTVLKDAAAAALYGSRAGNGVIIVTTKRAKNGKTQFDFNSSYGYSERVDDNFSVMNASQLLAYEDKLRAAGVNGIAVRTDEEKARLIRNGENWEKQIFRKGEIKSSQISMQSANETTNLYASFSSDSNTGLVNPWNGFERVTGRVKVDHKTKYNFSFGSNINMSYSKDDRPRESFNVLSPIYTAYGSSPLISKFQKNADGSLVLDDNGNPIYNTAGLPNNFSYFDIYENYFINTRQFRTFGNVYGKLDDLFVKGLSFKSDFSAIYGRNVNETFFTPGSSIGTAFGVPTGQKNDGGSDELDMRWVNSIDYVKSFGKHNLAVTLFTDYNTYNSYSYGLESQGFPNSFLQVQSVGSTKTDATTSRLDYMIYGYGGQANYDYDDKYFVSFSGRRDGNSRFGADQRFGFFPAASVGWKISSENFLKDSKIISFLKLYASHGTVGSVSGIGQNYSATSIGFPSYNNINGAAPAGTVNNPNLGWEDVKTTDIGLDFQLFNSRVSGKVEYFLANRTGFYFQDLLATEAGGYSQRINAGEFENKGLELQLNVELIRNNNFSWNVYGNTTFVKSKILDLNGEEEIFSGSTVQRVGGYLGEYFLVRYAGVNPANGEPLYYDIDGNVTNVYDGDDAVALSGKTPNPTYYGGFGTSFTYKGFDLSADFSFQGGNYIRNIAELVLTDPSSINTQNFRTDAVNFWTQPGQTNVLPSPVNADGTTRTYQNTDQFLQKGDFVRFRTLNFGYTFKKNILGDKIPLEKLRVYFQGQNLYTWTNFKGDPEVGFIGLEGAGLSGEAYRWAYPNAKLISFGLQITF
ncbi:SusC/RagA family TonB-linked outer membrane protein [Flavobacterium macrobrachii]|uniref:TonB-dependent receptor n=1 Tax=Flavobacterium macrobrachii TaxID=591204 RepID=A0ABS2D165_9FLAO|nr:TonB-dependent receptor [Flavobacterium macrobrachii]MBM6500202.1 TonB-dependent receptor [Flavobacterium macrobrachii]